MRGRRRRTRSRNAEYSIERHLRHGIGELWVDRTSTERLEQVFAGMAEAGYATSTIDHAWGYLNQACAYGLRYGKITQNPAAEVLLPEVRPPEKREGFTIDELERLLLEAVPADTRPALWLTGLMCGLRPGELAG